MNDADVLLALLDLPLSDDERAAIEDELKYLTRGKAEPVKPRTIKTRPPVDPNDLPF